MGSQQLSQQAANLTSDSDAYQYPLIHADATPAYTFPTEQRPTKRLKLASRILKSVSSHVSGSAYPQEIASAQVTDGSSKDPSPQNGSFQQSQPHAPSVPPKPLRRGRRKKKNLPPQSDPFIMEHMPFPEHQPWLKVRPRQRRAAVRVPDTALDLPSTAEAPHDGKDLVLGKHTDKIAALILHKRKDNDSKHFRQRMALQQRIHRGEPDEQDMAIAASHDELKRKMELSAQGIYEEMPSDGQGMAFRSSDGSSVDSTEDESYVYQNVRFDASHDLQPSPSIDYSLDPQSTSLSESSDIDDEYEHQDSMQGHYGTAAPILGAYVHYNQGAYYHQANLSNHLLALTGTGPSGVQSAENVYSSHQNPYSNQYPENPSNWNPAQQQPWTTHQMYQALPSTQTPESERVEMARNGFHTNSYDPQPASGAHRPPHLQLRDNYDYDYYAHGPHSISTTNSSSSSTPAAENMRMTFPPALTSSDIPAADVEVSAMRSNVNMFTRQARENGVIGGNNNVVIPPAIRRNMFDRN